MRTTRRAAAAVAVAMVLGLGVASVKAQEDSPGDEMMRTLEPFVLSVIEFTDGVRLDEGRLQSILEHMASLEQLGSDEDDEDLTERAFRDGRYDFDVILKDPEYVAWCASRGLSPRGYFKDLMRLESLIMRESVGQTAKDMRAQMPEQRRQIEELRGMMGDEAYQQALAAFDSSMAGLERAARLVERVPPPSAEEAALLAKYEQEIRAAMGDDEDEEMFEDTED